MKMKILFLSFLIFCFLYSPMAFANMTGTTLWKQVKLITGLTDDDPLFPSAVRIRLEYQAYSHLAGYKYAVKHRARINTGNRIEMRSEESMGDGVNLQGAAIHAVRLDTTINTRSLTSISVKDVNKVMKSSSTLPEFFYWWYSYIGFAPPPTSGINTWHLIFGQYVMPQNEYKTEAVVIRIHPAFHHVLYFYMASLCREREGNMAAAHNLRQIADSMLYDLMQVFRLAEESVDIRILPEVYSE